MQHNDESRHDESKHQNPEIKVQDSDEFYFDQYFAISLINRSLQLSDSKVDPVYEGGNCYAIGTYWEIGPVITP